MKPTPLLEHWQPPEGAGDPCAVLATTFAFDPDFFERDCLSRFLVLSTVDEEGGSVADRVGHVEMLERTAGTRVSVLADRSSASARRNLRWDMLTCHAGTSGALLHSKVTLLLWENATRVLIGSANLTEAGYRRQVEIMLAADLGTDCLLPRDALLALADELQSYLGLVPGLTESTAARRRAMDTLTQFRRRAEASTERVGQVRTHLAPTGPQAQPLGGWREVWRGPAPLEAAQVSPFWGEGEMVGEVARQLTGRPARARRHIVRVGTAPDGRPQAPPAMRARRGVELRQVSQDGDYRGLHAKVLLLSTDEWVAAMVGSSNHTRAGLGVGAGTRHREINLWLGAPRRSPSGKALMRLLPEGHPIADDVEFAAALDEDEHEVPALPTGFGLAELLHDERVWTLVLGFDAASLPPDWWVRTPGGASLLDSSQWLAQGAPARWSTGRSEDELDTVLVVGFSAAGGRVEVSWPVLVADPLALPITEAAQLSSLDLIDAWRTGRSLGEVVEARELQTGIPGGAVEDPLRRHDSPTHLLRQARMWAAAFDGLMQRLTRPVGTLDHLHARLNGPLGPVAVCERVIAEAGASRTADEAVFFTAEVLLTLSRVPWDAAGRHLNRDDVREAVRAAAQRSFEAASGLTDSDVTGYLVAAHEEVRRCLAR